MANKKIPDLTAASALAGTELVHVVQGGNSRRTTAQDIADLNTSGGSSGATPYVTTQTYTLSDVDGSGNLNIDLSGADTVEISVSNISSDTSERPRWRLSTDGGTTVESGNVYRNHFINDTGSVQNDGDSVFFGGGDSTNNHTGSITLRGHLENDVTAYKTTTATLTSTSVIRNGTVETSDSYDTLQMYLPAGSFDVVDVTVYKYNSAVVYNTDGIQTTAYTEADLEVGDADLAIDFSDYDCVEIIGTVTLAASSAPYIRVSTDSGSTYESTNIYREMKVDTAPTASLRSEMPLTPTSSQSTHHFTVRFTGHNQSDFTAVSISSSAGSDASIRDAYIETADVYDACKIYVDGTTISSLDVVVYRYNFAGNVNADAIDGDVLPIDFTPSNYTPDASPAEAGDVDDLAAHLKGIDIRFGHASINSQTGTTYTLVIGDAGSVITMDNASANTVTIPAEASVNFNTGAVISIIQIGAGVTTITADTGVTLNGVSAGSGDISAQYEAVSLMKLGADNWIATGGIGAIA